MQEQIPEHIFDECVRMAVKSFYVNESLAKFTKGTIDDCQEWLDSPEFAEEFKNDLEHAMRVARREIMKSASSLASMDKRREFLDRRLEHAIKCLKRKGLYADQVEALLDICEDKNLTEARTMLQFVRCAMGCTIVEVGHAGELDNTAWRIGIESAMLRREPELCDSDRLFGPYLEQYMPDILSDVVMAAYGCKSIRAVENGDYDDILYTHLMNRYLRDCDAREVIGTLLKKMSENMNDGLADDLIQMTRKAGSLEKELAEIRSQAESQKDAIAKATAPLHARIEKFETERSDLEKELAALRSENEALSQAISDRNKKLSELSGLISQEDLPELPESGVIFAGGHVNMVKKFMHAHPGWTFIDGGDVNFAEFRNPVLILFWDKHLSHPTWYRVKKMTPPGTPQAYLKSTNIDMLEQEMRRAWAAVRPEETQ